MPTGRRGGTTRAVLERKAAQGLPHEDASTGPDEDALVVLVQRGITPRQRHVVRDLGTLFAHAHFGEKLARRATAEALQDACFLKESGMRALFLPARFEDEMWLWLVRLPHGPSVRFQVINLHTIAELNFQHHVKAVRHPCLLSFDASFDCEPHLRLIREMLRGAFSQGEAAVKARQARDAAAAGGFNTALSFCIADGRVWMRAYDVVAGELDGRDELRERGPRLVLAPQRILASVLDGAPLWSCS